MVKANSSQEKNNSEGEFKDSVSNRDEVVSNMSIDVSLGSLFIDPSELNCHICEQFLSIPVFQCPDGNMLCSACSNIKFCGTENSRCRPIEKVLKSLKISCKNAAYGCKKTLLSSEKARYNNHRCSREVERERVRREEEQEQVVNPFKVTAKEGGKIDYNKLIDKFGCQLLQQSLVDRVQKLTNRPPHVFLRRGVFFAHRDFNEVLDAYERNQKFYLYTGRGPSSEALHLGHLIPFMFTKYLQEAFKVPLVIQLTDDEKSIFKNISVKESKRLAHENAKDIIACGFDISRTFIFQDYKYVGGAFYENMTDIHKCLTNNKVFGIFGLTGEDNTGKSSFPPVQAAPSFPTSFPHLFSLNDNPRCLIPCAIDQDPYFRMTRDVAPRLGYHKPALIESSFLPALQGEAGKMSASDPISAIYVTDSAEDIKEKINKYAFSGGQDTAENQRKHGANLEVDIPVKYLSFFLEDDAELEHIKKEYGAGRMLTGDVKKRLIEVLTEIVERHRRARAAVTDEMVDAFMAVRPLPNMFR